MPGRRVHERLRLVRWVHPPPYQHQLTNARRSNDESCHEWGILKWRPGRYFPRTTELRETATGQWSG